MAWTYSLHNANGVVLGEKGVVFVSGAPSSYEGLEGFFGGVINCQAQWRLGTHRIEAFDFSLTVYFDLTVLPRSRIRKPNHWVNWPVFMSNEELHQNGGISILNSELDEWQPKLPEHEAWPPTA